MRVARRTVLVSAALLVSIPIAAQQPLPRDPQAVQLLSQAFVLMGGAQKSAINDVLVRGTLASAQSPDQVLGTFVSKARGADFTVEMSRNGQQMSYKVLKGNGSIFSQGNATKLRRYNTSGLWLDILPLFARWTQFSSATSSVEYVGATILDGAPCNLIHVEFADDDKSLPDRLRNEHGKIDIWVDSSTGMVAAMRYRATQSLHATSRIPVENRFREYANFSGILLPTRITRYLAGQPVVVLRVQSVSFNNGFTDSDFQN